MGAEPLPRPCASCPYRRDVPSGVWHPEEYAKLAEYDRPTIEQPVGRFLCHQRNGHTCSGWAGCHDMSQSLGLRMAASFGHLSDEEVRAHLEYECEVPLFATGAEAAAHGMRDIDEPSPEARAAMTKLLKVASFNERSSAATAGQ